MNIVTHAPNPFLNKQFGRAGKFKCSYYLLEACLVNRDRPWPAVMLAVRYIKVAAGARDLAREIFTIEMIGSKGLL